MPRTKKTTKKSKKSTKNIVGNFRGSEDIFWTNVVNGFKKFLESPGDNIMDIGILNNLGYIEVIEISIWLGAMYYGKCWIDYKFRIGE